MAYRMLVVDLDGTTIPWDAPIADKDIEAAHKLADAGVAVTIATGRIFSGSIDAARALGVQGSIACVNGSHLADVQTGEDQHAHTLTKEALAHVEDMISSHALTPVLLTAEDVHHGPDMDAIAPFIARWSERLVKHPDRIKEWDAPGVLAAMAFGPPDAIERAADELEALESDALELVRFTLFDSGQAGMKVRVAGHTKGTALATLAEERGLTLEETVAVGDWHNDVPMLKAAGLSFVMAQAEDTVAQHADHRLKSDGVSGGAIAEIAERVFGVR
ncbi:MAG: HAD-IIB family hydrolase [Sandaracinaceae bacterium]